MRRLLVASYLSLLDASFIRFRPVGKALDVQLLLLVPQAGLMSSYKVRHPCGTAAIPPVR